MPIVVFEEIVGVVGRQSMEAPELIDVGYVVATVGGESASGRQSLERKRGLAEFE